MIGKASVTGKMVLVGKLVLQTPLIIGGGSDEQGESDIVVLKDELGMPYIPAPPWPVVFGITFSGAIGRTNRKSFSNISTTSGGPLP